MASLDNVPADDGSAAFAAEASSAANIIVPSFVINAALPIVSPINHSAVLALRGSLPIRFFNSVTHAVTLASGALASDK